LAISKLVTVILQDAEDPRPEGQGSSLAP